MHVVDVYWGATFYLSNWEKEAGSGRNLENRHEMYRNPLGTGINMICLTLWTVPAADIAIKMQKTTWGHKTLFRLYRIEKRNVNLNFEKCQYLSIFTDLTSPNFVWKLLPNTVFSKFPTGWVEVGVGDNNVRKLHLQWWGRQRAGTLWTPWRSSLAGRRPGSPYTPRQHKYFLSRTFISWHYYNSSPALHWISEVTKWMRRGKILLQSKPFFWKINFRFFWLLFV